jgi:hypothetical protein
MLFILSGGSMASSYSLKESLLGYISGLSKDGIDIESNAVIHKILKILATDFEKGRDITDDNYSQYIGPEQKYLIECFIQMCEKLKGEDVYFVHITNTEAFVPVLYNNLVLEFSKNAITNTYVIRDFNKKPIQKR